MKELSYAIVISVIIICITYTLNHNADLKVVAKYGQDVVNEMK